MTLSHLNLDITYADILAARKVLEGKIYKTGMPRSNYLSESCKGIIHLKFENMQRTGSFKIRGAYNKLSSLTHAEKKNGVIACSAGNHAQGVSLSGTMLGINSKIVMPETAPKSKVNATREYGAEVVLYGESFDDTIEKAQEIIQQEGRTFIAPFDDVKVIAGQGTIGLEILEDLYDVNNVIVPIGGGGLIAGIALALKSINPTIKIIGVQSENVHGMAASYRAGQMTTYKKDNTIADGCNVATPGVLTYEITKALVDDIILVSEDEIKAGMFALVQRNKVVSEGAGALATAALLSGKLKHYIEGKKTVSVISGGNIDMDRISQIINPKI